MKINAEKEGDNIRKEKNFKKYITLITGENNFFKLSPKKQMEVIEEALLMNPDEFLNYIVYLKNESTGKVLFEAGFPKRAYSEKENYFPVDF